QRRGHGLACAVGPFDMAQRLAGDENDEESARGEESFVPAKSKPRHAGERNREKRKSEYADERRVPLQRRADGGVPGGEPRKAAQDPASQPFDKYPGGGNQKAGAHRRRRRDARLQPACCSGKKREEGAKEKRGEAGE